MPRKVWYETYILPYIECEEAPVRHTRAFKQEGNMTIVEEFPHPEGVLVLIRRRIDDYPEGTQRRTSRLGRDE